MTVFFLILREGVELSLLLLLLTAVYKQYTRQLIAISLAVFAAGVLISVTNHPFPGPLKNAYTGFLMYSFVMVLLMSFVADRHILYPVIAVALMVLVPAAETASVVLDAVALKGISASLYIAAGVTVVAGLFAAGLKMISKADLSPYFDFDGVFVVLAGLCFLFGGVDEFDHAVIVTSVQQGFQAFLSSFIPFIKNELLMPDGKTISTVFDGPGEFFTSPQAALAITACILFLPPLAAFMRLLRAPEPETGGEETRAQKRKIISLYRAELVRKGSPLLLALLASIVLLHSANRAALPTYDPEPAPVISDGDVITVPLKDARGDMADGRMRKYVFSHQGETFRFIVLMRPDGEMAAALDACEICPPRGYAQRGGYVICTYCNTPIPLQSVGKPGGCNPIPVPFSVKEDTLTVSKSDIVTAYRKEAGKETGAILR